MVTLIRVIEECKSAFPTGGAVAIAELLCHPSPEISNRRCLLSVQNKGLSSNDGYITGVVYLSDRLKLSAIGEDNRGNVTSNPIECKQVAHTRYS